MSALRRVSPVIYAAGGLLVVLNVLQEISGDFFLVEVAVALIVALFLNWGAYLKLRRQHRQDRDRRIESLKTAVRASLFLALVSSAIAGICLFVLGRALGLVDALTRSEFLVWLSWALLLVTGPAIYWLRFKPSRPPEGDQR